MSVYAFFLRKKPQALTTDMHCTVPISGQTASKRAEPFNEYQWNSMQQIGIKLTCAWGPDLALCTVTILEGGE